MPAGRDSKKLDLDGLWTYALRVLGRRGHSAGELKQKLAKRAGSPSDLSATMAKLREYGFSDDEKFSEAYAGARLQNQGHGAARVLRDLRAKRIAPQVAERAVQKTFQGLDEQQLVRQFLERRYRTRNLPEFLAEPKNLASVYRRLRISGFSSRASLAVLKEYAAKTAEGAIEALEFDSGPDE